MAQVLTPTTGTNETRKFLNKITPSHDYLAARECACSTKSMRSDGGYEVIKKAISKLGLRHREHIAAYGDGNERRLTGRHETADINTFIWVSTTRPS